MPASEHEPAEPHGHADLGRELAAHTAPAAPELTERDADGRVHCRACAHRCRILPDHAGVCGVRFVRDGALRVPFGYVSGLAVDPVEKKPFYHVLPGAGVLSFGMLGCDFHCPFCQNWNISQALREPAASRAFRTLDAEDVANAAFEHGCPLIASTYNEPLITPEWAVAILRLARPRGTRGLFISNGYATPEALAYLRPHVAAFNVDLKAFSEETYRRLGGSRDAVTATITQLRQLDYWVEVVTLVVPGLNDSDAELTALADFVAGVSPDIPWHVTAYHPEYKFTSAPRTPPETLLRARDVGRRAGLHFVYVGNLPGAVGDAEDTACPACGRVVIRRRGYRIIANDLAAGRCPACGVVIPGVWS